jgi:precorrin-6B methylase 2
MKRPIAVALTTGLLSALPAFSFDDGPDLDVPYVPTPQPLVELMLDMVDLKDGDVVWDLGCGDGRMVITAAGRKQIRGVGVDLDPRRIEESKANAKEAGVEDRVEFRVADLFETDFSDATVLTMYLLETVNRKLRPVILSKLEPGARIVSNTFTMGEWRHDEMKTTDLSSFPRTIYHWVVPANITGEWTWEGEDEQGALKIDQKFQVFSGTASINGKEQAFEGGKISGKEIVFEIKLPDGEVREYTATAEGDVMTGSIGGTDWKATRKPGTKVALDEAPPEE